MPDVELQQIGPYIITQLLRVSSTSSFYQGKQPSPRKKEVLIKRLSTPLTTPEAKEAFLTRAKQLRKLKNRAIVDVQEASFDGDYGYLVMEYVAGETLRQHIPVGEHLAPDEVKRILSPIAGALHYAHVNNTLHCNLYPGHILVGTHHDFLLTEFSLSLPDIPLILDDEAFAIPYMAPEHLRGQPTAASDQYALAVMVYEWLCGRRPYEATERHLLLQQQEQVPLSSLHSLNETISPAVERVIHQALSYNPAERFPHTQAFADNYLSALMGFPVKASMTEVKHISTRRSSDQTTNKGTTNEGLAIRTTSSTPAITRNITDKRTTKVETQFIVSSSLTRKIDNKTEPIDGAESSESVCSKCGTNNRTDAKYCSSCKQALQKVVTISPPPIPGIECNICGATNRAKVKYCFSCGRELSLKPLVSQPSSQTLATNGTGLLTPNYLLCGGRYCILDKIGQGGYGAVYKAHDTRLERLVAVKEMTQDGLRPQEIIEASKAFEDEAKLLARLKHPSIPEIYDHFPEAANWYFVMAFIDGETLEEYLRATKEGKAPIGDALYIGIQLCRVLNYLHNQNIIFRDLKPSNIMWNANKQIFLIDFGIARHFKPGKTKDTTPMGTVGYAAPEQYGKGQTSPRSDIYSLGVLLCQMLSGNDPLQDGFHFAPLQLGRDPIYTELSALITSMLNMDANKRPESMSHVQTELQRIRERLPRSGSQFPATLMNNSALPNQGVLSSEEFVSHNAPTEPLAPQSSLPKSNKDERNVSAKPITPLGDSRLQKTTSADLRQGGILSQRLPGYEERPAQVEMAGFVSHALTQNVPAIIEAGTGTGKALDVDTPIPTLAGWKRMGDLTVGDMVFDEKGNPTRVTAAFNVMYQRKCYEVVFSDGSSLVADAEHEWVSYTYADRKRVSRTAVRDRLAKDLDEQRRDGRAYTLVTTEEMAATLTMGSAKRANYAVAVTGALTLPEVNLPIAPYFLGVWLGEGNGRNNQITTADPGLINAIEKDGYTVRSLQSHPYLYTVDDEDGMVAGRWKPDMTDRLRALRLLLNKHIPMLYLRASEQQRRALLAGLINTDGTVNRCGAVEFTTTNPQLAQDAYELVCSLGFRASVRQGQARCNGKDSGPKWTLAFTTDEPVFRLERKVATHKERLHNYSPERNLYRYVVAVREVPSRPVRCIQVESPSHLYLAGRAMIPTHNSLAYLVPIVRSGKVAIVSTANKALQEQLFYKDIPFVQRHIKHFEAALVKGVANYLCLDRVEEERTGLQFYTKNRDFQRLLDIVNNSDSTFTGDFETLGFQLPGDIRSRVATDSDQCAWTKCSFYVDCYVRKMREQAERAKVIVVNHTLLLLDAAIGGFLLPERDVIILDEAHHLEEEATRSFTVTISPIQITTLLAQRMLKAYSQLSLQAEADKAAQDAWSRLAQVADPGYKGRINLEAPLQEGLYLATAISELADSLRKQRPLNLEEKESQLYDKLLKRTQNLADDIRTVFSVEDTQKFVYYVERVSTSGQRGFHLQASAAPLDVTMWLKERLFDKCNVICTSATLATVGPNPAKPDDKGPNFSYFRRRVGLDPIERPDVLECILPLAFDYEGNALLYLPRDLPEPTFGSGSDDYMKAIAREMYRLVKLSRGRAFLLFSSKRMLDRAYELMSPHLHYPLLKQGDMTRLQLTRRFREEEGSVLFGLKSFWEGVDIAGDTLSLVAIDKLPFDPPDDPVHEARVAQMKKAGENWFGTYVLPQAVLRLKQGLGRLLRTREDRGVMAILDTRLHTKGYGKMVLNALPPARRTSSIKDVERFFAE